MSDNNGITSGALAGGTNTHPAPDGAGISARPNPIGLNNPLTPIPLQGVPGVRPINPPNPPPVTTPTKFQMKKLSDARMDIDVSGEVLADGTESGLGMRALTRLNPKGATLAFPRYETDDQAPFKVLKETTKFILKGSVTIKTVYDPNGGPTEPANYGRGTTDADKKNKDTTSGFHESCHRTDYTNWLRTKPIPEFKGKVGMNKAAYEQACSDFEKAWDKYFADAEADSETKTDEVGYTKTQYDADHAKKP
jgi:hypothetical protein